MEVDLNGLLNCPLCVDMLCKPVSLLCLHSFCERCISDYIAANVNAALLCPVCRSPFNSKTPLCHDFFKQSLVDMTRKKSSMCRRHKAEKIVRFCRNCCKVLCADCLVEENHSGHDVVKAEVAEREAVEILAKQQHRVVQHTCVVDKLWGCFVQQTTNEIDAVTIDAKRRVKRQADEMYENIRKKTADLTNEIDNARAKWILHLESLPQHATKVATLSELDKQLQKAVALPTEDKVKFCQGIETQVREAVGSIPDWSMSVPKLKISFVPSVQQPVNIETVLIEAVEAKKKDMVFVQCMDGHHVTLAVDLDEPVDKVTDLVESKTGIPASGQSLFYRQKALLPGVPLRVYGIERDTTLTLKRRAAPPSTQPVSPN